MEEDMMEEDMMDMDEVELELRRFASKKKDAQLSKLLDSLFSSQQKETEDGEE